MKPTNFKSWAVALCAAALTLVGAGSCNDDPGVDHYYTQSKEYAADYLKNRSQYTQYLRILERATGERGDLRLVDLLATYGSYTVFAPTNAAVDEYLASKGVATVDDLSKEDCDTIAQNSIIEMALFTTDYNYGEYPKSNMLERVVSVKSVLEWDEERQDSVMSIYVNQTSRIQHADDSVSNGVVHTMANIVSARNNMLGSVILEDTTCTIFAEALRLTGLADTLQNYIDESYVWASEQDRIDSCTWTNDKLCILSGNEYDNVAYPEKRYYNYTAFVCQDQTLSDLYGITDIDGLREKAREIYRDIYPDGEGVTDETDRRNYLNRLISYHIIDRYGSYWTLTSMDNDQLQYNFNRRKYDINDWYETLLDHTLIKFSFPSGQQAGLYINRRGVQGHADERGVFVRGTLVRSPRFVTADLTAVNGLYHYIDGLVAFDHTTRDEVLDDVIRLDCTTLSPDFMTKLTDGECARAHSQEGGKKYAFNNYHTTVAVSNHTRGVGFRDGCVRNFSYTHSTHMHVRPRCMMHWSYEGDELLFKGRYDVTIKLPPVPAGTYEVRMMTCVNMQTRGIVQYYLGTDPRRLEPQGIPFDMRRSSQALFGWTSDDQLGDNDAISSFDRSAHNLGWLKGPKCFHPDFRSSFDANSNNMRNIDSTIRRIIGTFVSDGKSDYYMRVQQKMESDNNELNMDFIELVPSSVYNNEYFAEPVW